MVDEEIEKLKTEIFELRMKVSEQDQDAQYKALRDAGWPPALIKAVDDPFDYALRLKDGSLIFFEYAVPCGKNNEWVSLHFQDMHYGSKVWGMSFNHNFNIGGKDRGLEVRVSEIVWAADAPYGS
jgi:hypothetical protein